MANRMCGPKMHKPAKRFGVMSGHGAIKAKPLTAPEPPKEKAKAKPPKPPKPKAEPKKKKEAKKKAAPPKKAKK